MKDNIDDIQGLWKSSRKDTSGDEIQPDQIVALAKEKKRNTVKLHFGNMIILIITLIGISLFFKYIAPFNQILSHIGIGLMTGGLLVRILIEIYSLYLSSKVNLSETALKSSDATYQFYKFRKRIHGPTTIVILICYTLGFYLLTPEFSLYFNTPMIILIDLSYVVGAIPVGWSIRNAIKKEMYNLDEILRLKNKLME